MFFVMAIAGMVCTGAVRLGPDDHGPEDGLLAGLDARRPGAREVLRRALLGGRRRPDRSWRSRRPYQFGESLPGDTRPVLVSPQASIMKALVEGFMSRQPAPLLLFGVGAAVAVIMEMLAVPALIVALGMYLPLELNSPALVGGIISYYVAKRAESTGGAAGATMRERAVIIASGLMAGGALGGVFGAGLRLFGWYREDLIKTPFYDVDQVSQLVSIAGFVLLCLYQWFGAMKKEKEKEKAA
jgi:hypothetical protein